MLSNLDIDDENYINDSIDLHRGYDRPKLVHLISPYVRTRLKMARLAALIKHSEVWG